MIKIIVVDDHPLFRMGIKSIFSITDSGILVTGEADCGEALFHLLSSSTKADVILLDINLPDISGVDIAYRLKKEYPDIKILTVSAENTSDTVKAMIDAGIDGFISKRKGDTNELVEAINSVMDGLEYFGKDIAAIIYDIYVSKKKQPIVTDEFSDREKEIILACKEGLLSKEIASKLDISINTVNTHKKRIFQKLGINSTIEMVQYALKNGIIRMDD